MKIQTKIIIGLLILLVLVVFGVIAFWPAKPNGAGSPVQPTNPASSNPQPTANQNGNNSIANPASVNCVQKGGKLEIRTAADGGQVGYCIFPDGSSCEEWQYFRGQCQPKSSANPPDNTPHQY